MNGRLVEAPDTSEAGIYRGVSESIEEFNMIKVQYGYTNAAVRFHCVFCGGWAEKGNLHPAYEDSRDSEQYFLCFECCKAGPQGIEERIKQHMDRLRGQAEWLAEFLDQTWEIPTNRQVSDAEHRLF